MLPPTLHGVLHPDGGIAVAPVGDDKIDAPVSVDVAHHAAGLLIGGLGNRQIALSAGQVLPRWAGKRVPAGIHDCNLTVDSRDVPV